MIILLELSKENQKVASKKRKICYPYFTFKYDICYCCHHCDECDMILYTYGIYLFIDKYVHMSDVFVPETGKQNL